VLTSGWTREHVETLANRGVPWVGSMDDPEQFMLLRGWIQGEWTWNEKG
jgi:hypothetical protein